MKSTYTKLMDLLKGTKTLDKSTSAKIVDALNSGDIEAWTKLSANITADMFLQNGETILTQAIKSMDSQLHSVIHAWDAYNAENKIITPTQSMEFLNILKIPKNEWPEHVFTNAQLKDIVEKSKPVFDKHAVFDNTLQIINLLENKTDISRNRQTENKKNQTAESLMSKTNDYLLQNFKKMSDINIYQTVIEKISANIGIFDNSTNTPKP